MKIKLSDIEKKVSNWQGFDSAMARSTLAAHIFAYDLPALVAWTREARKYVEYYPCFCKRDYEDASFEGEGGHICERCELLADTQD